ncbi:outer membrane protein, OMP85 family [Microthyrium microscopicum]|uniref:Outer membrane protein, OMP85 family n=1 Tax=Microthyrium microscopicum TaxID=703497 RepID=A0A6A6TXJ7_9PEZI|nr:outer membrane protein, OMP85 family [Microthyrium microscopicum]
MAEPLENDLFDQLRQKSTQDELNKRTKEIQTRLMSHYEKQERRIGSTLDNNSTIPVTISEVRVLSAPKTRRGFLDRIVSPIISKDNAEPYTLVEARKAIDKVAARLSKLGIYQHPISVYIDKPDPTEASSTPTDLKVYFNAKEGSWYTIKTGTEAGTAEGSIYGNAQFRNLFGGAEALNIHASKGTRTRSVISAAFDTPILSNPDLRWEISGLTSSTLKPWASHEEVLKGGSTKFKYETQRGHLHEIGYSGMWRQLTSLASNASPGIRLEAGDSFKSSLSHTWIADHRDNRLLPSRGFLLKTVSELAGVGPLKGDVGFGKLEAESQLAVPIPIPGIKGDSGVAINAGFRAGLLYPLTVGGSSGPVASRFSDRFQLGGPTDVRGFKMAGLGPHDGPDALGGDMYAAGGVSLLVPLPRTGKESPLRLQAFLNAGRLVALKGKPKDGAAMDSESVKQSVKKTLEELKKDHPSAAAGVGLVYAHPLARFELNVSMPLAIRKDELARKGLQFGIGITFM